MNENETARDKEKEAQELELQKKMLLKHLVEPAAYERLMNVRIANNALYNQVISLLLQAMRGGKVKGKITEMQVVEILRRLKEADVKREGSISIHRK